MKQRCSCPPMSLELPDGSRRDVIEWPEVDCPVHGFPADTWYAGHHLRVHALMLDRRTGKLLTTQAARARIAKPGRDVDAGEYNRRFRLERPSETYARLLSEVSA